MKNIESSKSYEKTNSLESKFFHATMAGIGILGVGLGLHFAVESVIKHETTSMIPLFAAEIVAAGWLAREGIRKVLKK